MFARTLPVAVALWVTCAGHPLCAQNDLGEGTSSDANIGDDPQKHYLFAGPMEVPEKGYGLVIVLPAGDPGNGEGAAERMHHFIREICRQSLPKGYIVAHPVAVKWNPQQELAWPTAHNKAAGMKFTTEQFVSAIVDDLPKRRKIDPDRIFMLSWSSAGPAAYAAALSDKRIRGAFIAMSSFRPGPLRPLDRAKDRRFYLYHSAQDTRVPLRAAQQASQELRANGAKVKLATYEGPHGWPKTLFDDIRTGMKWLEASPVKRGDDKPGAPDLMPAKSDPLAPQPAPAPVDRR